MQVMFANTALWAGESLFIIGGKYKLNEGEYGCTNPTLH
jgi:hypothetical protein